MYTSLLRELRKIYALILGVPRELGARRAD
jgi:hypothetical protein